MSPEEAPLWTLRAVPTGAARDDGAGAGGPAGLGIIGGGGGGKMGEVDDDDDDGGGGGGGGGDGGGGGRVGLAELYYLLSAAGGTRAMDGAETMGGLASAEYW